MDEVLDEAILGSFPIADSVEKPEYGLKPEKSVHH